MVYTVHICSTISILIDFSFKRFQNYGIRRPLGIPPHLSLVCETLIFVCTILGLCHKSSRMQKCLSYITLFNILLYEIFVYSRLQHDFFMSIISDEYSRFVLTRIYLFYYFA